MYEAGRVINTLPWATRHLTMRLKYDIPVHNVTPQMDDSAFKTKWSSSSLYVPHISPPPRPQPPTGLRSRRILTGTYTSLPAAL